MTTKPTTDLAFKWPANVPSHMEQLDPVVIDGQVSRPMTRGQRLFLQIAALALFIFGLYSMIVASGQTY